MKKPSHSTVVAYLALFVALGGSAYAVSRIDSGDIQNHSIKGKDVASETLGSRQINESKLSPPAGAGAETSATCDPPPTGELECVAQKVVLKPASSLLVIATGSKGARAGTGICSIAVDGVSSTSQFLADDTQHDGFAITKTTAPLPAGNHTVALRCSESGPDLTIDNPTVAAIAVDTQR